MEELISALHEAFTSQVWSSVVLSSMSWLNSVKKHCRRSRCHTSTSLSTFRIFASGHFSMKLIDSENVLTFVFVDNYDVIGSIIGFLEAGK